jgi:hypothetical protein
MKKYSGLVTAALISIALLVSCKKSINTARKDYTASVKDRTWSGEFTYTGKVKEYYSVHFNENKTLLWSRLSGDYTGKWVVNDDVLTMTFDANTVQVKANITDDDKFFNISDNTGYYEINSGQVMTISTVPLDNTVWKGPINLGALKTLQLGFKPGYKVEPKHDNIVVGLGSYSYKALAAGGGIRIEIGSGSFVFAIFESATEMKGSWLKADYPLVAIKQ